jgi:hypothetical protein
MTPRPLEHFVTDARIVGSLCRKRIALGSATQAYGVLTNDREALGIVLEYPQAKAPCEKLVRLPATHGIAASPGRAVIGLIGAGNFAKMTLLPSIRGADVQLRTIVSAGGVSGVHAGKKFGFEQAATDYRKVIEDPAINLVIITTRHDLHAKMTLEALQANKHVAVEKPLCLTHDDLNAIRDEYVRHLGLQLVVGFNRRFSPHAVKMKQLLAGRSQPMCMTALINAGAVSDESWVRTPVDRFILAKLDQAGLKPSPAADTVTLIRRLSLDLTGLPPTPADVDAFVADTSATAYEKVVDRLLASPHYGERWGRHWLDLAGYADSEGILDADYIRTAAWRYRDYVIRSFNTDKPYDRFLREQIAGDEITGYWNAYANAKELPPEVVEGLIATGFLRCASDTSRPDFAILGYPVISFTEAWTHQGSKNALLGPSPDPALVRSYAGPMVLGLQGYDGHLQLLPPGKEKKQRCLESLEKLVGTRQVLERNGIPVEVVTGAGTGTCETVGNYDGVTEMVQLVRADI